MKKYANLIRMFCEKHGWEKGAMCGFDLMMGMEAGDADKRAAAWERFDKEIMMGLPHTDTVRDGLWVPAIPL